MVRGVAVRYTKLAHLHCPKLPSRLPFCAAVQVAASRHRLSGEATARKGPTHTTKCRPKQGNSLWQRICLCRRKTCRFPFARPCRESLQILRQANALRQPILMSCCTSTSMQSFRTHVLVRPPEWWEKKRDFDVLSLVVSMLLPNRDNTTPVLLLC